MRGVLPPDTLAALAQAACLIEASAPKPGNVTPDRSFADTTYEDFLLSAAAIGAAFRAASEATVGATILRAVRDTRRLVRVNTNLGIVLLLAPLARAAGSGEGALRERVALVLATLTVADARDAFAAIRLAAPGGLGSAAAQDVRAEATVTLREAMALAAGRDSVAREYATDYDVTFGTVMPALREARSCGRSWSQAAVVAYLRTLAAVPDTLIARKQGAETARAVSKRAGAVAAHEPGAVAAFDAELRARGLNPGTTADLIAAGLFVGLAEEI